MSFSNFNIGKNLENLETSEAFDAYARIDVVLGEDEEGNVITVSYPANVADDSGRILTVDMPMCTDTALARQAAQRIYNSLMTKDPTAFQYQPMVADGSLADPSMEFGDSIDVNGVHGGFFTRTVDFGRLMKTNLSAPSDEEIDHEYPYEDAQQRQITRANKEFKSGLYVTNQAITAEVQNRQTAVNGAITTMRSELTATASSINANVSRVDESKLNHTRTNTSFGWKLTADGFYLNASGNRNVFTCTKDGIIIQGNATVTGKIQATSGYIGSSNNGFTITGSAIYNGKTALSNTADGVYIGRDGIALGANNAFTVTRLGKVTAKDLTITGGSINLGNGVFRVTSSGAVTASNLTINGGSIRIGSNFSVTSAGNVTANNMTLTGTLTVGGSQITAAQLRQGAQNGYDWNNTYNPDYGGTAASYALSGAGAGYSAKGTWDNARNRNIGVDLVRAGTLIGDNSINCQNGAVSGQSGSFVNGVTVGGYYTATWQSATVVTGVNFNSKTVSTATLYYLGR